MTETEAAAVAELKVRAANAAAKAAAKTAAEAAEVAAEAAVTAIKAKGAAEYAATEAQIAEGEAAWCVRGLAPSIPAPAARVEVNATDDPDLATVIRAWPKLTEALKGRLAAEAEYAARIDGNALSIRDNNAACNGVCPVCGGRTDPGIGPDVFVRGTFREVCHECGERLNPALMLWLRKLVTCWDSFYQSGGLDFDKRATLQAMEKECPFWEPHALDGSDDVFPIDG